MFLEKSLKGFKVLPKLRRTDRFASQIRISTRALMFTLPTTERPSNCLLIEHAWLILSNALQSSLSLSSHRYEFTLPTTERPSHCLLIKHAWLILTNALQSSLSLSSHLYELSPNLSISQSLTHELSWHSCKEAQRSSMPDFHQNQSLPMQICQRAGRRSGKWNSVNSLSYSSGEGLFSLSSGKQDGFFYSIYAKLHFFVTRSEADNKRKMKKPKAVPPLVFRPPQFHGVPCSACTVTPDRPRTPLCGLAQEGDVRVLYQIVEINPRFLILLMHYMALQLIRSSPGASRYMLQVPLHCVPLCGETRVCHPLVMLRE